MNKTNALSKRVQLLAYAGLMVAAAILPAFAKMRVEAYAQPSERSINISTSEAGATDVTYTVSFKPATTITAQGIVVEICDSPLVGTVCSSAGGSSGFDSNEANLAVTATGLTLDAATDTNTIVLTGSASLTAGTAYTITLGNTGGNDGVTNPSAAGSFYGRIITYTSSATAVAYDSSTTGENNPGAATDAGGVAMSTANQITVNARVQEVLVFCVGTDDANAANDCSDITGNTVDLGVVQAGALSTSPVATSQGGNNKNGLAMVRTNAVNGVTIDYFAEAVTGDTGSTHMGALRVSGATCTGDGTFATGSKTDQCFNSMGLTQTAITDEGFGMTLDPVDTSNGTTANLTRDTQYDGVAGGFAWSATTTDTIASSTASGVKVVDDELMTLRFAAQAAVTTPTGQYGVTSTYIATASY